MYSVFVTLANVPKELRGSSVFTFVHSVTKTANTSRHSMKEILRPLIEQIEAFVNGVDVRVLDADTSTWKTQKVTVNDCVNENL